MAHSASNRGTTLDDTIGGTTIVEVDAKCSVGITTKGTASDALFRARIQIGAKVPALTKIP
jgi:hypothetical protein